MSHTTVRENNTTVRKKISHTTIRENNTTVTMKLTHTTVRGNNATVTEKMNHTICQLVSWCFEPSQSSVRENYTRVKEMKLYNSQRELYNGYRDESYNSQREQYNDYRDESYNS